MSRARHFIGLDLAAPGVEDVSVVTHAVMIDNKMFVVDSKEFTAVETEARLKEYAARMQDRWDAMAYAVFQNTGSFASPLAARENLRAWRATGATGRQITLGRYEYKRIEPYKPNFVLVGEPYDPRPKSPWSY